MNSFFLYSRLFFIFLISLIFLRCSGVDTDSKKDDIKQTETVETLLSSFTNDVENRNLDFFVPPGTKVNSITIDSVKQLIAIDFNKAFSFRQFREKSTSDIYAAVKTYFGYDFKPYAVQLTVQGRPVEDLIPNYYRTDRSRYDKNRMAPEGMERPQQLIRNVSRNFTFTKGLSGKNIVLWHSHGWFYDHNEDRWMWQRPRLFQTVEDLNPMAVTIPYLIPMLENAGATVFVPRERDIQTNEVIVDNDTKNDIDNGAYSEWTAGESITISSGNGTGFAYGSPPYADNLNPFKQGTYRLMETSEEETAVITWQPDIPEEGYYAVYISFAMLEKSATDAHYTIYHDGGTTDFLINQQIGGGTFHYLGTFKFNPHSDLPNKVTLSNSSNEKGIVTADAVRFGGGMSIVERNGSVSGRPKFVEAARYYLQFIGMPDSLVYNLNNDSIDYNDDYQCRSEYANYLNGAPAGPNSDRNAKGLGIPIDLSLAFHTDAGIEPGYNTVGTLSIYSTVDADTQFTLPNGVSRLTNRDLADIMQTQLTDDIRALYDTQWSRRQLMDAPYAESYRPNVPSMLLELLSHQNFYDMILMRDPRFRFDVARAMYKAMLRYLSAYYDLPYKVQPLPVNNFSAIVNGNGSIHLSWSPVPDSLEPGAMPDSYIIYTRKENGGFDNGIVVDDTAYTFSDPEPGVIYSFKVAGVNEGGEGFPSEILAACYDGNNEQVLIVNGFDRICGASFVMTDSFQGFTSFLDAGVPDKVDIGFTGYQFDYDPKSEFLTNNGPGHGASFADYETKVIAGNSFDYPFIHGIAVRDAGYGFSSVSDEALTSGTIQLSGYPMIDFIFGEEKATPKHNPVLNEQTGPDFTIYSHELITVIKDYLESGGNIFISGAYIGTELFAAGKTDSLFLQFAREQLHLRRSTNSHASRTGMVHSVYNSFLPKGTSLEFNTALNDSMYAVEAPDEAVGSKHTDELLRYSENLFPAAYGYRGKHGIVFFGFPFESITGADSRSEVMKSIFQYLEL